MQTPQQRGKGACFLVPFFAKICKKEADLTVKKPFIDLAKVDAKICNYCTIICILFIFKNQVQGRESTWLHKYLTLGGLLFRWPNFRPFWKLRNKLDADFTKIIDAGKIHLILHLCLPIVNKINWNMHIGKIGLVYKFKKKSKK